MTDDPTFDNDESQPGNLRKIAEEAMAAQARAEAQLSALQRKDVFRDAGIDFGNPLHAAVANGYTGELEPEAVKAFIDGVGLTKPPEPPPTNPAPQPQVDTSGDAAAFNRMAGASTGEGQPPPNPNLDRMSQLRAEMEQVARTTRDPNVLDRLSIEYAALQGSTMIDTSLMEQKGISPS